MPARINVGGGDGGPDGAGTEGGAGSEPASGTVTIATYNVRNGRGEGEGGEEFIGIVSAARALDMVGVVVAVFQETKITDPVLTSRSFRDCSILAATANNDRRGEVALLIRENNFSPQRMEKRWG